jgi:transcriptional regulator with XRE-family HTH domain
MAGSIIPGWTPEHAHHLRELLFKKFQVASVRALADYVHLSPAHLAEVLSGRRSLTSRTLEAFAKALNVSSQEVLEMVGCVGGEVEPLPSPFLNTEEKKFLFDSIQAMPPEEFVRFRKILLAFFLVAGKGDLFIVRGLEKALESPKKAVDYLSSASEENLVLSFHALLFHIDPVLYASSKNLTIRPIRSLSVPPELEEKVHQKINEARD